MNAPLNEDPIEVRPGQESTGIPNPLSAGQGGTKASTESGMEAAPGGTGSSDDAWGRYQQSLGPSPCEEAIERLKQVEAEFTKIRTEVVIRPPQGSDADRALADHIEQELLPRLDAVLTHFQAVFAQENLAVADRAALEEFVETRKQSWRRLAEGLRDGNAEKIKQHSQLWMNSTVLGVRVMATKRSLTKPTPAQSVKDFRQALVSFTPRVIATPLLIAINVLVFAAMVATGADFLAPASIKVLQWGADFGPKTMNGEWWRLVTCMFLHFGIFHLGFNMWVLWDLGRLVERLLGSVGFLVLYFVSGIAGSIASLFWNPVVVAAGASGAVFGVGGGLLAFFAFEHKTVPAVVVKQLRNSMLLFLAFNLYYGMKSTGIDMAAHIGGLAAGFACGLILRQPLSVEMLARRKFRNAVVVCISAIVLPLAALALPHPPADVDAELPTCTSNEVVDILNQILRQSSLGPTLKTIDGFRELSYDPKTMVRRGECVVHANAGDDTVQYVVQWQNREKGLYEVRITSRSLPSCTSPEVIEVLNKVIGKLATGIKVTSVTGYKELMFDPKSKTRQGRCVAHTAAGDIDFQYTVRWRKEETGQFEVLARQVKL